MSIQYQQFPSGGFGNRLFQLNFLGQLSKYLETEFKFLSVRDCREIEYTKSWSLIMPRYTEKNILDANFFTSDRMEVLKQLKDLYHEQKKIVLKGSFLGDFFFDYTLYNPGEFVRIKNFVLERNLRISMHFRGSDFQDWNKQAILDAEYYLESLDYIDKKFGDKLPVTIITDDLTLSNLSIVFNKIRDRAIIQSSRNVLDDFKTLVNSTAIISSPSTFSIWGGILGKQDLVTHSRKWVNQRVEADDKFWIQLLNGGSQHYSCTFIDY